MQKTVKLKINIKNPVNLRSFTKDKNKKKIIEALNKRMVGVSKKIATIAAKKMVQSAVTSIKVVGRKQIYVRQKLTNIYYKYFIAALTFVQLYKKTPIDEIYFYTEKREYERKIGYKDEVDDNGKKTGKRVARDKKVVYEINRVHIPDDIETREYWKMSLNGVLYNPHDFDLENSNLSTRALMYNKAKSIVKIIIQKQGFNSIKTINIWNDNPIDNQYARLEYGLYECNDTNPVHQGKKTSHGVKKGYSVQAPRGIARLELAQIESLNEDEFLSQVGITETTLLAFDSRIPRLALSDDIIKQVESKLKAGNNKLMVDVKMTDSNTETDPVSAKVIAHRLAQKKYRASTKKEGEWGSAVMKSFTTGLGEEAEKDIVLDRLLKAAIQKLYKDINKAKADEEFEGKTELKINKEETVIQPEKKIIVKKKVSPSNRGKFGEKIIERNQNWTETVCDMLVPDDWDTPFEQEDIETRVIAIDEMGEEWVAFTDSEYIHNFGLGWHKLTNEIRKEIDRMDMNDLDKLR